MTKREEVTQVNEVNRISSGTEFRGTLIASCDIRIDGFFDGKLYTTGKLVLGETAKLYGNVVCKSCDIYGLMEGKIIVKDVFGLRKTGSINGNVGCQKIFIEEGGLFSGSCKMINESNFEELKSQIIA